METLQSILNESKIKGYFSLAQITIFTEKCLTEHTFADDEYSSPTREDAFELVKKVMMPETELSGTSNDYHNYAMAFARADQHYLSCDVLICGLNRYPKNVDLLADYLICAIRSDKHYVNCENYYKMLQSLRPQFWNGRAYDFSISYLLDKIERGIVEKPEDIKNECLNLAHEFQERIPTNEFAYVAEANIYSTFGEPLEKKINILKKTMKKKNMHIVRAAISLAEIYIERNDPTEALKCIRRILTDFADINSRTTPAYIYILSVVSKTSKLMKDLYSEENTKNVVDKNLAQEIIDDWANVKKLNTRTGYFFNIAKTLVEYVELISGIKIDGDDDL